MVFFKHLLNHLGMRITHTFEIINQEATLKINKVEPPESYIYISFIVISILNYMIFRIVSWYMAIIKLIQ